MYFIKNRHKIQNCIELLKPGYPTVYLGNLKSVPYPYLCLGLSLRRRTSRRHEIFWNLPHSKCSHRLFTIIKHTWQIEFQDVVLQQSLLPMVAFPALFRYEGAGRIVSIGSKVKNTDLKVRDAVLLPFNTCGHCKPCTTGHPAYCHTHPQVNHNVIRVGEIGRWDVRPLIVFWSVVICEDVGCE